MKITMSNKKLQLLLTFSLAVSSGAFAPPSPISQQLRRTRSSLAYLDDCSISHANGPSINSECSSALIELDSEMDTFASPNDKRYSAGDWLHNMLNFHNSSILSQIRQPVGVITVWSTLVSLAYKLCVFRGWGMADKMCLGSTPHSFIASTIGLLLVFRTNSAYQKFRVRSRMFKEYWPTC